MTAQDQQQAPAPTSTSRRNEKVGQVVSTKMQKTIVVEVEAQAAPPVQPDHAQSQEFYAHDEQLARLGDVVRIEETRPLSRLKRWRLKRSCAGAAAPGDDTAREQPSIGWGRENEHGSANENDAREWPTTPARRKLQMILPLGGGLARPAWATL